MSNMVPVYVRKKNLSEAWVGAITALAAPGVRDITPLIVNISEFDSDIPSESGAVRTTLDLALAKNSKLCVCETTANTIFPLSFWMRYRSAGRDEFFRRYLADVLPRLKARDRRNAKGTYFERFISYSGRNQLEHVLSSWNGGNHRRSALQAVTFDPASDHTNQPFMGFPCLDYVAFAHDEAGRLSMTALYAQQYIFDRAYGNYLGLCRLGRFMAEQMGLRFAQLTCIASCAQLGAITKTAAAAMLAKMGIDVASENLSGEDGP